MSAVTLLQLAAWEAMAEETGGFSLLAAGLLREVERELAEVVTDAGDSVSDEVIARLPARRNDLRRAWEVQHGHGGIGLGAIEAWYLGAERAWGQGPNLSSWVRDRACGAYGHWLADRRPSRAFGALASIRNRVAHGRESPFLTAEYADLCVQVTGQTRVQTWLRLEFALRSQPAVVHEHLELLAKTPLRLGSEGAPRGHRPA